MVTSGYLVLGASLLGPSAGLGLTTQRLRQVAVIFTSLMQMHYMQLGGRRRSTVGSGRPVTRPMASASLPMSTPRATCCGSAHRCKGPRHSVPAAPTLGRSLSYRSVPSSIIQNIHHADRVERVVSTGLNAS
jgi:hypothetical protein